MLEQQTSTLDELLVELKSLNKRKRQLHKLISEHPDNKTLEHKYLEKPEISFLNKCYHFLNNNPSKNLVYDPEGGLWFRGKELGYSMVQFYSLCESIFTKGSNYRKITKRVKDYGTWENLNIKIDGKMIQISSLTNNHYVISTNKNGRD